ncbi:MAG: VTT domain-containing protein [Nitriliruptoraceae bacterium]
MTTDRPPNLPRAQRVLVRIAVIVSTLVLIALIHAQFDDPVQVRATVIDLGALGVAVFIVSYAVAASALVPAAPFTIAAGILYGPALGTLVAIVGATLGAVGARYLGRSLGRSAVVRYGGSRVAALDDALHRHGFAAVLVVRLIPVVPFNVVNVTAGVTAVSAREFVVATAIGIIPGAAIYAALGGTINDPTSPMFLGAVAAFAVLTVVGGLLARRMRRSATRRAAGT